PRMKKSRSASPRVPSRQAERGADTSVCRVETRLDAPFTQPATPASPPKRAAPRDRRANDLDGAAWTRYSISVWSDIRKTPEEIRWNHPAMFPSALAERLIDCLTTDNDEYILDPFLGSGSTILAADRRQKT